ncbi:MAG: alkaline phosphatase family protein [Actinomycetota bacterium]|nr:alkaline phosphatase family protein [Actinomycetota bacterium]
MPGRRSCLIPFFIAVAMLVGACDDGEPQAAAEPERTEAGLKQIESDDDRPECRGLDQLVTRVQRGYFPFRSPDIIFIPREPNYVGSAAMPVHSGPWDYLAHVPLVAYGPGHIRPGTYDEPGTVADLAPTAAEMIGFDEWPKRDGRVLNEMLEESPRPPKLVVNIVWDGGGWNALDAHPNDWPYLKRLMEEKAASYENFEIGSSPSVTPPIHTNLGTGSFPARHGIVSLKMRAPDYEQVDPFALLRADNMKVTTLADEYDRSRGNEPVTGMLGSVSWHLGMIGHGSALPGADKDPVALLDKLTATVKSNTDIYTEPVISDPDQLFEFASELDAADGVRDEQWEGHPLTTPDEIHYTPATVDYDRWLLQRLIETEGFGADEVPDLLYVNFKTSDIAGHKFGMTSPEVGAAIRAQDANLRKLVGFLDRTVGKNQWVFFLTADHGQTPYPEESGAWPIYGGELARDMNEVFDKTDDDIPLIRSVGAAGIYIQLDQLEANDARLWKMARWVAGYTVGENLKEGEKPPAGYSQREDELLFDAVLSKDRVAAVACREA